MRKETKRGILKIEIGNGFSAFYPEKQFGHVVKHSDHFTTKWIENQGTKLFGGTELLCYLCSTQIEKWDHVYQEGDIQYKIVEHVMPGDNPGDLQFYLNDIFKNYHSRVCVKKDAPMPLFKIIAELP